jgi:hypothetical protein
MKMKLALAAIAGCAALCLALPAFGQTANVIFNGADPSDQVWNGVYAGVYDATVTGAVNTNKVICDDYNNEVTGGESWTATVLYASKLNASNIDNTMFGAAIGLTGYTELAYLVNLEFTPGGGGYTVAELNSAIWAITSGGAGGPASWVNWNQLDSNAKSLVAWLETNVGTLSLSSYGNLFILTPVSTTSPMTQEFWGVPEGGAALLYLLLAGLACFGAMRFSSKKEFGIRAA